MSSSASSSRPRTQAKIGKSACDQCRYCTEYCPRFLLGYAVEPHQVMRTLAFTGTGADYFNQWAAMCCSCGLCTLYACPEELFPKEACDDAKAVMRAKQIKWTGPMNPKVHAMADGRRVPIKTLAKKLHVLDYDLPAPLMRTGNFTEPPGLAAQAKRRHPLPGQSESRRPRQRRPSHRRTRAERAGRDFARADGRHGARSERQTYHFGEIILWPKNLLD